MMVYDQRNVYYPGKEAYVLGMKGADMYRYKKTTTEGLQASYDILQSLFEMAENASTASVLNYYFMATTKLVQAKVQWKTLLLCFQTFQALYHIKKRGSHKMFTTQGKTKN